MAEMIALQITIFSMVAVGAVLSKTRLITVQGSKAITNLVIYVILPCNILNSCLTSASIEVVKNLLVVFVVSTAIQLGVMLYGKARYRDTCLGSNKNYQYALIVSNAAFMGFPIAESTFGSVGLLMASIYTIPPRIMMWTNGLSIFSDDTDVKEAMKKVLAHPCMIACEIGIAAMFLNVQLPAAILQPIQTLSRCNTALSMMIVGFALGEMRTKKIVDKGIAIFAVERLFLVPMLVYVGCRLFRLDAVVTGVCTLLAAMPAGAMTSVMASKYNGDEEHAARLVVFTTIISMMTVTLWSTVLK